MSAPSTARCPRRAARGFTLLELVVALALFALVSVMALQVLTGALHQRRVLERSAAQGAEVLRTLTLLRRDLEHLVPLPFRSPLGEEAPAYAPGEDRLALSVGGQPRLPPATPADGEEAGFQRVIWRHDPEAGTLSRRVWGVLNPRDPEQIGDETVHLTGVRELRVAPAEAPGAETAPVTALPRQIEVVIDTAQTGTLRVLVTRW